MTRHYVNKVDGPSAAAILNNAGGDNQWASLDRYGRRRRSRRTTFWATEMDDDELQHRGCYDTMGTVDDEGRVSGVTSQDIVPASASLTSVRAVVEEFDDISTEQSPLHDKGLSPLTQDTERTPADATLGHHDNVTRPDRVKPGAVTLTLSWDSRTVPASAAGSALAARACSEGDVLSGVEAAEAAARRGSRLLSCASALLGRFVTETRQRLMTVSGSEWRRRCDIASKQQYSSSGSFGDALATSADGRRLSGNQTVAATPTDEEEGDRRSTTTREEPLFSLSEGVDSNNSRQQSQRRRVANAQPSSSTAGLPADSDVTATTAAATLDHEMLQRSKGSKKRPTIRRYPSVERLDLPRRRAAVAATILDVGGQSQRGADRKRAERFRRQYVEVKLQRESTPLEPTSMKSMPAGVDVCGTTWRDVVASPQLLRVPASADVLLS